MSAAFLAACSSNAGTPIANGPATSSIPPARETTGRSGLARFLQPGHTPAYPPPRRHHVTGAERARARAGGWTPLTAVAPWTNGPGTEMQMTDGTVLVQDSCTSNWFKLTPDNTGSYLNGTWTKVASMPSNYAPLYFASAVLPDGKLIVNGGEYNSCRQVETNLGAIYDPVADTWTAVTGPGWGEIGDAQSAVLANGTYMLGNCCNSSQALLNESTMTWTIIGTGKHDNNSEEGWTLLKNGDLLTADVIDAPSSELYNPKANMWTSAGTVPVNLASGEEIGPQTLLPNNTVFVAGATGATAIYNTKTAAWSVGPTFPVVGGKQVDTADAPSSLLTNGTVMLPASPGLYNPPATFFIFNGKKLAMIAGPPQAPNDSSYDIRLLTLPNGQVLETDGSTDVEVYTGSRRVYPGIAPVVTSVATALTHGATYKIKGRRFNGASQANMYGDDAQQATNYPLVRITNAQTGHVFYARTHNHSFMGVASNKQVTTMFDVPAAIETGASTLVVVANGIASSPVSVTIN